MLQIKVGERLASLEVKVSGLEENHLEIKQDYVTLARFWAVEKLTYGYAAAAGAGVWIFVEAIAEKIML